MCRSSAATAARLSAQLHSCVRPCNRVNGLCLRTTITRPADRRSSETRRTGSADRISRSGTTRSSVIDVRCLFRVRLDASLEALGALLGRDRLP
jgi:hypothetical protein